MSGINLYFIAIHETLCLPYAQQLSVNILTKKFFCHKQLSWEIFKVYVRQGSKVNLKCLDYVWVHIDGHFGIESVDNLLLCDWLCIDYIVKETTFINDVFFIVYETLQVDSFFMSYQIELSITTWSKMMSLYIYV